MLSVTTTLLSFVVPYITQSQVACVEDGSSSSYTEQIVIGGINEKVRKITASGCPNHPHPTISHAQNAAYEMNKSILIPATPCINSDGPFNLSRTGGAVAITLNGISIFSAWTGQPDDPDAIASEGIGFDGCSGHATGNGEYHYHMSPACLLHQLDDEEEVNTVQHDGSTAHSPQIGWAFDGFPVYGTHGTDGYYTYPCTHTDSNDAECLDACNGHTHDISSHFLYHYHITGPVGDLIAANQASAIQPTSDMYPYTIGCLMGIPYRWSLVNAFGHSAECSTDIEAYTEEYTAIDSVMNGITDRYTPWTLSNGEACTFNGECSSEYCDSDGVCRKNTSFAVRYVHNKQYLLCLCLLSLMICF